MSLVHRVKEGWSGGRGWTGSRETQGERGRKTEMQRERQRKREGESESWLAFRGVGVETVGVGTRAGSSRGRGETGGRKEKDRGCLSWQW